MLKPEIVVFAGPNGSGKSTIFNLAKVFYPYVNADDIKSSLHCTDLEAAEKATELRENLLAANKNFSFETVLSTRRNLELLKRAKEKGYFIRVFYVLTISPAINVMRIKSRVLNGGHNVPEEKVHARYDKALLLLPELIQISDILHIYDNSQNIFRIFKKRKTENFYWENSFWSKQQIEKLVGFEL
jgi:predicted ABC-type ATPase